LRDFSNVKRPVSGTFLSLIKHVTDARKFSVFLVWTAYMEIMDRGVFCCLYIDGLLEARSLVADE
jgi:hypothetical protein